jgi:hypothetical protein
MNYEDNPLHVEIVPTLVPVAREIRIDVAGELVIDPKRDSDESDESNENIERNESIKTKCKNALELTYFAFLILLLISFIGGFILFLVWIDSPDLFGKDPNSY